MVFALKFTDQVVDVYVEGLWEILYNALSRAIRLRTPCLSHMRYILANQEGAQVVSP